jgi:hypothetical protein
MIVFPADIENDSQMHFGLIVGGVSRAIATRKHGRTSYKKDKDPLHSRRLYITNEAPKQVIEFRGAYPTRRLQTFSSRRLKSPQS